MSLANDWPSLSSLTLPADEGRAPAEARDADDGVVRGRAAGLLDRNLRPSPHRSTARAARRSALHAALGASSAGRGSRPRCGRSHRQWRCRCRERRTSGRAWSFSFDGDTAEARTITARNVAAATEQARARHRARAALSCGVYGPRRRPFFAHPAKAEGVKRREAQHFAFRALRHSARVKAARTPSGASPRRFWASGPCFRGRTADSSPA